MGTQFHIQTGVPNPRRCRLDDLAMILWLVWLMREGLVVHESHGTHCTFRGIRSI